MDRIRLGLQILAGFIFLFQSYRVLKDEVPEDQIVKATIFGILLGLSLNYLYRLLGLNLSAFGLILTVVITAYIFHMLSNWRFWLTVEKLTWPGLACLAIGFGGELEGLIYLFAFLISFYWRNYRNFLWYPSGKVGFFFLVNLTFVAFFHLGLDFYHQRLVELIVWSISLVVGIAGIIILSGREKVKPNLNKNV